MRRAWLVPYAVAVVLAAVAVLITASVAPLRERGTYLLPLTAVTASAWYGGLRPGMTAAAVAAALLGALAWTAPARLAIFLFLALGISVAGAAQGHWRSERERLRTASQGAERRFAFLAEASSVLGASLDYDATLTNIAKLAVPFVADWCTVDLLEPGGGVRRVALAHGNPPLRAEIVRAASVYPPDPEGMHPRTRVLATGRAELFPDFGGMDLARVIRDPAQLQMMREIGYRSAMIVPLAARGQTLGAVTFATTHSGRRYGAADLSLAEDLARRAALAVDNARLYRDAQQAREQAEAASQAKDEFLAVVSHELRTPLAAALLWARMLARGGLDPARIARAADTIERSMRRQARLVEDLLDASRIVTGSLRLDTRPVELAPVVAAAVEAVRPLAIAKGVDLAPLPGSAVGLVLGDPERLQQIFANLLENAVEFTPAGGRVAVGLDREGDRARVRVSDNGEGIAADLLPHVFERFRQGDSTSTRVHGGLGLGLTIVRELVGLHGGTVRAESEGTGLGSTFTVELPLTTMAAAQAG